MILRNRRFKIILSATFLASLIVGYMNCGLNSGSPFNILVSPKGTINNINQITGSISAGADHTCAINSTGQAKCWGNGQEGQLGSGSGGSYVATPVTGLSGTPVKIVASQDFTCAMLQGGTVQCWGVNSSGQLGNNTPGVNQYNTPVTAVTSFAAYDIAASANAVCIVTQTGIVQCWGSGNEGQLGNNATTNQYSPVTVYGITNAVQITAGFNHFCALLSTGQVACWGSNNAGQLGNNSTTASYVAVTLAKPTNVIKVVAGFNNTCALLSGGTVDCWGDNSSGQLNNGNTSEALVPSALGAAPNVTDISIGYASICTSLAGGNVLCVGYNQQGQLGDNNSTTNSSAFVGVQNLGGTVTHISSSFYHVCASLSNGKINCWGYNNAGQIGNNTTTDATTAQAVQSFP